MIRFVYVLKRNAVDVKELKGATLETLSNSQFIKLSKKYGKVFNLSSFMQKINDGEITTNDYAVRSIEEKDVKSINYQDWTVTEIKKINKIGFNNIESVFGIINLDTTKEYIQCTKYNGVFVLSYFDIENKILSTTLYDTIDEFCEELKIFIPNIKNKNKYKEDDNFEE